MNLPSEVVIIAGDSRFDPNANRMARLEAHELLNAAGRAGRAGEVSQGFVLIVPSKVMDFESSTNQIHRHWSDLRAIFSQSDQCLVIDDPFTALLDQIHASAATASPAAQYLLSPPAGRRSDRRRRRRRAGHTPLVTLIRRLPCAVTKRYGLDRVPDRSSGSTSKRRSQHYAYLDRPDFRDFRHLGRNSYATDAEPRLDCGNHGSHLNGLADLVARVAPAKSSRSTSIDPARKPRRNVRRAVQTTGWRPREGTSRHPGI